MERVMAIQVENIIDSYGYDKVRSLILDECVTQVQLHKTLGLSDSNSRMNANIYKRIYKYLNIEDIPYKEDTQPIRKLKRQFDLCNGKYWESEYIVEYLINSLQHPLVNMAGNRKRYVISFPKHPKADPASNQVKAHIVVWELVNEMYVPENHWVVPIDDDYTNLDVSNLVLVNTTEYKSKMFAEEQNPSFKHGLNKKPKLGGWTKISKDFRVANNFCKVCRCTDNLLVHHVINYHLFKNPIDANSLNNLLVLCQKCHRDVHNNKINLQAHIEATQYSKLLKLLETLKSQVPDSLIEIYKDVEKHLGLTGNQQPST